MNYTTKSLGPDHAFDWLRLRREGTEQFPLGFLTSPSEAAEMSVERAEKILSFGQFRGVFCKTELVGFVGYRPQQLSRTRHRAEIGPFYVTSRHQGTGAARLLMANLVEEAIGAGVEQLELYVDTENVRAIRFYERLGFQWIATHPDGVRIDGQSRSDHFYSLRLVP